METSQKLNQFEEHFIQIADEDMDGGFLLLTPKGAGAVNGSGECFNPEQLKINNNNNNNGTSECFNLSQLRYKPHTM